MQTIILICTVHNTIGNCNSFELYKIIEKIQPDIIFEELPLIVYDDCYKEYMVTLETTAVKEYIKTHSIKHIPIDTFDKKHNMHKIFAIVNDFLINNSPVYQNQIQALMDIESEQGFTFTNSKQCDTFFDNFQIMQKRILFEINDNYLTRIYNEEKNYHSNRENEMIQNIYNYSKQNNYNKAIFFIGAGHRKSIIRKLYQYNRTSDIHLHWKIYNPSK